MQRYLAYVNDTKAKRLTHVKRFLTAMGRLHIEEVVACVVSDQLLLPAHVCTQRHLHALALPSLSYLMVFKNLYLLQIAPVHRRPLRMMTTALLTC